METLYFWRLASIWAIMTSPFYNYFINFMYSSIFLKDSTSLLQVPPHPSHDPTNPNTQCSVKWIRKYQTFEPRRYNSHNEYQKLYQIITGKQKSSKIYECSPFDVGYTIIAQVSREMRLCTSFTINLEEPKQYKFGPIQTRKALPEHKRFQNSEVGVVINKRLIKMGKIGIRSELNSHSSESLQKISLIQIQLSINSSSIKIGCDRMRLGKGPEPFIRIFSEQQSCLEICIEHERIKLLEFLKPFKIFVILGKYLRFVCENKEHRDFLLYQILGLHSENSSNIYPQENFYATTFGRNHLRIRSMFRQSSSQDLPQPSNADQLRSKSSSKPAHADHKPNKCNTNLFQNEKSLMKSEDKSFNNYRSQQKDNEEGQNDEKMQSFSEDFDKLFQGGCVSDNEDASPPEYVMEELYNILYTPYSRSRKHSFGGLTDSFLKESRSNNSILRKKQQKGNLSQLEEIERKYQNSSSEIDPYIIRLRMEKKQQESSPHYGRYLTPHKQPLCDEFQAFEQPPKYLNYLQSKPDSTYQSPQFVSSRRSFTSTTEMINFTLKEQQLNKKIEELTKQNEQLTLENKDLKKKLKQKNQFIKKQELNKMKQIKQMALDLVQRLENVEKHPSKRFNDKVENGSFMDSFTHEEKTKEQMFVPQNSFNRKKSKQRFLKESPSMLITQLNEEKCLKKSKRSESLSFIPSQYVSNKSHKNLQILKNYDSGGQHHSNFLSATTQLRLSGDRSFNPAGSYNKHHGVSQIDNLKNTQTLKVKKNDLERSINSCVSETAGDEQRPIKQPRKQHGRRQTHMHITQKSTISKKEKIPGFLKYKEKEGKVPESPKIIISSPKMGNSEPQTPESQLSIDYKKRKDSIAYQGSVINKYVNKGQIILNYYSHNPQSKP